MLVINGLTAKLLKQGFRYHTLIKPFSSLSPKLLKLISKFNVGLKSYTSRPIVTRI